MKTNTLDQVTREQWERLSQRTVYFGHQSVGGNIMDGMRQLLTQNPQLKLNVVSGSSAAQPGVLNEFQIGENEDPDSKNSAFMSAVQHPLGAAPVLMFKYCYVDVEPDTDARALLQRYQKTVAALKAKHPEALIVHVTMPLTTDSTFRHLVNTVMGKPTRRDRNAVRTRYNELLREAYPNEPIFDLAAIESTRSDGGREYAEVDRQRVYALAPEWAADEGHLNPAGRRRAAEQLLVTLAALPQPAVPR